MSAARREEFWQKYKDEPGLIVLEIYIEEELPNQNCFAWDDPDLDAQPSTMEQRIKMYGYSSDSLKATNPVLIDSMDNLFGQKNSSDFWQGKPDAVYIIGVDGKFTYTYYYYHTWDWQQCFDKFDNAIADALKDLEEDVEAPEVKVTSPKAGDELDPGGTFNIEWTATDNYSVASRAIFLSTDNGSTWEMIDSADLNTGGTYTWEVPTNNSGECKIKVSAYDRFFNEGSDESGTFSIGPTKITSNIAEACNRIMFKKTQKSYMIFLPFSGNNEITISDAQGREISSFTTSNNKLWYTVPVSLSSGMHIVSIRTEEKTMVRKFWFVR